MIKQIRLVIPSLLLSMVFVACGQKQADPSAESREAKQLMQGVWFDADSETILFKMEGDSVYYPDTTSMTTYFKVVGDTLYMGTDARYAIKKQSEHVLWFENPGGDLVKLVKGVDADSLEKPFVRQAPQILTLNEVLKRDTVVSYDNVRYHVYIAVNPTRHKVVRHTLNEDGLDVENVYYDNIVHVSVFKGSQRLFSSNFNKRQYAGKIPAQLLEQVVLNDIRFERADNDGFHFNASVCIPGEASCYLVEHIINYEGHLSTQLQEY